jgi:hypothetical protein
LPIFFHKNGPADSQVTTDSRAVCLSESSSECRVSIITITCRKGDKLPNRKETKERERELTLCHAVPFKCSTISQCLKSHTCSHFSFSNRHCISNTHLESNWPAYLPQNKEHIYNLLNCVSYSCFKDWVVVTMSSNDVVFMYTEYTWLLGFFSN